MIYLPSRNLYICEISGQIYTQEEMDKFQEMEKAHKESLPKLNTFEALSIYPEAKPLIKRQITEINHKIDGILEYIRDIKNQHNPIKDKHIIDFLVEGAEYVKEKLLKQKKELELPLKIKKKDHENFQEMIQAAKQYPIDSLIEFNRSNKALSIFTKEKTPSMHYNRKTNTVYCFSTHRKGDAIDVAQIKYNLSFVEAVRMLTTPRD